MQRRFLHGRGVEAPGVAGADIGGDSRDPRPALDGGPDPPARVLVASRAPTRGQGRSRRLSAEEPMTVRVERFEGTAAEWDAVVRSCADWTHFHLYGWRSIIEKVFAHECLYLAARAGDGRLVGLLPLVRVKSLLFGHYLVSMPFLNYGGPLGDAVAVRALADEAVSTAKDSGAKLLELRCR